MTAQLLSKSKGFLRGPNDKRVYQLTPGRPMLVTATGAETGDCFGVAEENIAPGDGPRLHVHEAADELAYILAGEFTWQIGDLRATGGMGSVAFVPRGTAHTWRNSGSAPGRMLFVFSPAGFEQFLIELSSVPPGERTPDAADAMSARYRTTYVGPPLAAPER
jgi:quercetin dioxygenase-like cupin family protein